MNKQLLGRIACIYNKANNNYNFRKEINIIKYQILKEEPDNINAYNLLGKIYYKMKEYEKSIDAFKQSNNISQNQPALLGLFKSYVANYNFETAQKIIKEYENVASSSINCDLLKSILNAISTNLEEIEPVNNTEKYMHFNILESAISDEYENLILEYNQGNYVKCIEIANLLQRIVEENNMSVEFYTLIRLLYKINAMKKKKDEQEKIYEAFDENSRDLFINLKELLKSGKYNISNIKSIIKRLSMLGYGTQVDNLLTTSIIIGLTKNDIKELRRTITDGRKIFELGADEKSIYEYCILKGDYLKSIKEYETAFDIYEYGYYVTEQPIFIYYMGRCCYLSGLYESAIDLYTKYLSMDKEKEEQARYQLYAMTKSYKYMKQPTYNRYEDDPDYDKVKYRAQKKIKMTVEDFLV